MEPQQSKHSKKQKPETRTPIPTRAKVFEKMPQFWKEGEIMTESALERLILLSHA